jgi:hypothetical protein
LEKDMRSWPIPAQFTISDTALRHIAWVRAQYEDAFPDDPPVMAGISLGGQLFDNGTIGPLNVVVGFWRKSEFKPEALAEVQRVSGLDLIFPIPAQYKEAFDGKELHFTETEGLFLREPAG